MLYGGFQKRRSPKDRGIANERFIWSVEEIFSCNLVTIEDVEATKTDHLER